MFYYCFCILYKEYLVRKNIMLKSTISECSCSVRENAQAQIRRGLDVGHRHTDVFTREKAEEILFKIIVNFIQCSKMKVLFE